MPLILMLALTLAASPTSTIYHCKAATGHTSFQDILAPTEPVSSSRFAPQWAKALPHERISRINREIRNLEYEIKGDQHSMDRELMEPKSKEGHANN